MVFRRHNRKKTAGEHKASTADVPALFLDGAGSQWFLLAFLLYALGAVCQFLGMDPRDDLVRLLRMEPGTEFVLAMITAFPNLLISAGLWLLYMAGRRNQLGYGAAGLKIIQIGLAATAIALVLILIMLMGDKGSAYNETDGMDRVLTVAVAVLVPFVIPFLEQGALSLDPNAMSGLFLVIGIVIAAGMLVMGLQFVQKLCCAIRNDGQATVPPVLLGVMCYAFGVVELMMFLFGFNWKDLTTLEHLSMGLALLLLGNRYFAFRRGMKLGRTITRME